MRIEKKMKGREDGAAKKELMQLAKDEADILFDVESEIIDLIKQDYLKNKKPGQNFLDYLGTKDREYFRKIPLGLKKGGQVISISEYLKQKDFLDFDDEFKPLIDEANKIFKDNK